MLVKGATGNQPDYQPDDQPGYLPDPSTQLIPWAVVSDDEIDDTLTDDHDFRATNFTARNLIKGQIILAEKCRCRTTLAPLQWRHNGHDSISNHQPHDCLLNRLFRCRSKKTSKLRVTGFCTGNSPGTGEFPAQMASYAENVCIWWSHHDNARLVERLSDLSLGLTKIPYLMLPPSHIRRQAQEKPLFMEEELLAKDDLCEKVATIHTETMRCLVSEKSKHLFPLLRNCKAKLARSRAAAHGKCVYENIAKHEATRAEMEDSLITPLPYQEFHWVTHRPRNRSRSPLRGSHSPKPRPRDQVARPALCAHVVPMDTTTPEAANLPLLSHMCRLPKEDPTTAPRDKPTKGDPNNQPPTTGTPSNPSPTMWLHHCSSSPENLASLRALIHRADSSIKLSGHRTTQTQTSGVRWAARFSGHWVVTSMFA